MQNAIYIGVGKSYLLVSLRCSSHHSSRPTNNGTYMKLVQGSCLRRKQRPVQIDETIQAVETFSDLSNTLHSLDLKYMYDGFSRVWTK